MENKEFILRAERKTQISPHTGEKGIVADATNKELHAPKSTIERANY
jgi:hypothetical protein